MALRRVFGLVENGEIVAIGDDLHKVVAQASGPVMVMDGAEPNPGEPAPSVQKAIKIAGLPDVKESDVVNMPLETAFKRLKEFGIAGATPAIMARSFLKSNAKLAKQLDAATAKKLSKAAPSVRESRDRALAKLQREGFTDGICKGVVLLPYNFANKIVGGAAWSKDAQEHKARTGKYLPMSGNGLCTGSSQACRDSCLAFAGKNTATNEQSGDSNIIPKRKQVEALYFAPEAFLRMLLESIWAHERACAKQNARPYVRMNVLSDIPWEAWVPWFFNHFTTARPYDYSKLPGRVSTPKYDLTLSFAGGDHSAAACRAYLKAGGRVAVVFVHGFTTKFSAPRSAMAPGIAHEDDRTPADRSLERPLPKMFWGAPVVDGDGSDIRPLDPKGVVIGLRWKVYQGRGLVFDDNGEQKTNTAVLQRSVRDGFVYPWYMDEESGVVIAPELPGMHNTEGVEQ